MSALPCYIPTKSASGQSERRANQVKRHYHVLVFGEEPVVWFDTLVYVNLACSLLAPALPWLLARRSGKAGVWASTLLTLLLLVVLQALLKPACIAANCGQGAILLGIMWAIGGMSAFITLVVTVLMTFVRTRQ